jgi:hypothetical protein
MSRLNLNAPSGQGVDPRIYACPATRENQCMLADMIDYGYLKIAIIGRAGNWLPLHRSLSPPEQMKT